MPAAPVPNTAVRFGLSAANFGTYAEPARFAQLAEAAEAGGWDGLFVWDHLSFAWGPPAGDPWLLLAGAAHASERLRLGTHVTPVARHRPETLALTVATLDRLAGGRVVFGAGLGGNARELAAFGEDADERLRAAKLDEALGLLRRWWDGESVTHRGEHFVADGVALAVRPLQAHLPIWIGGNAPRPLRRAARFDGWAANSASVDRMTLTADDVAARVETIRRERGSLGGFDVAVHGLADRADPAAYAGAGATWWLESVHDRRGSFAEMLALVAHGPPR
jgi:alkanesulfonate monooxygenase SsuD/methylene tetrahydromethanopterin reductase-like flavin-dependent oxidoreductase (luciferase family)